MAKITFQDALPRRSLYENTSVKPREKSVPALSPDNASATDKMSVARAEAADILAKARTDADKMSVIPTDKMSVTRSRTDKMSVAVPAVPIPYVDWIARIGLSPSEAAQILGVTERTAYRWSSKPDTLPPLAVRVLALIEHNGLDVARTIVSGLDAAE